MKFTSYLFAPGMRMMSVILGFFMGGIVGLALQDWQLGVLVGASAALFVSFALPLRFYMAEAPYRRAKKELTQPFLLDERVRFTVKDGSVGGYFVLTDKSMIFLSMEKGDHRLILERKDVKTVKLEEDLTLRIFLNNTQFVRVISADGEGIYRILGENGWETR